jgi:hypothetical protein
MMENRVFLSISVIVSLFILSACSTVQSVLDATRTQTSPGLNAVQTAQAKAVWQVLTPASGIRSKSQSGTASPFKPTRVPEILFEDDFSDPESGWGEYSDEYGSTAYTNGSYSISVSEADYCYWNTLDRTYSDVVIEVDVQKVSGPETNEFGVICRLKDNDNFYYSGITSEGYFGFGKMLDGEWTDLGSHEWDFNDIAIKTGDGVNRLKVTCDFGDLVQQVNGTYLANVSDPDFRTGDIGLYVCAYDEGGVEVLFDNFLVTTP